MPITSAATSMSRTAIHERPVRVRERFFATSASSSTMASTRRYRRAGVSIGTPAITIRCAVMTPELE